ncbi:MAG: FliM/FliN family flagellar motor switch protein [Novosphingobium sp.]|nr:FliM/FliN family flagellar motor switch protein [Novosphingobium sp.]
MKPQRDFMAERPLARHCPELLKSSAPVAADLLPLLAQAGETIAARFAEGLSRLSGSGRPRVRASEPRKANFDDLSAQIAPLAANSLVCAGHGNAELLVSFEAEVVFRLLDRAFGGSGEAPSPLPEAFPLSGELFVTRLEAIAATALDGALGAGSQAARVLRHHASLERLLPFAPATALSVLTLDVEEAGGDGWSVTIAVPVASIGLLIDCGDGASKAPGKREPANPASEPFADMPIPVSAVLVDMAVPFAKLSALRPGDVLPVSVARKVPLKVGGKTIAHGTVGSLDDCVAVQITQAF